MLRPIVVLYQQLRSIASKDIDLAPGRVPLRESHRVGQERWLAHYLGRCINGLWRGRVWAVTIILKDERGCIVLKDRTRRDLKLLNTIGVAVE
jgi:hypothetical protein